MIYLYSLIWFLFLPFLLVFAKISSRKRGGFSILNRLKVPFRDFPEKKVWIHCASIGEVNSSKPLIDALKEDLFISTFTDYGEERVKKLFSSVPSSVIPVDIVWFTDRFVKKIGAEKLLIYETEIWPSLFYSAFKNGVDVYIVSGKITEGSFNFYRRFSFFFKPIFSKVTFLAKSEKDAERAEKLGFKKVKVVGDLKFDSVKVPSQIPEMEISGYRYPIVIWGSTHEGEEELAVKIHNLLKEKFPNVLTVIAPRHTGRVNEVSKLLSENRALRSKTKRVGKDIEFYIIDTVGELSGIYSYGDVAVIGGTFNQKIGGHNPLEPLIFKKPVFVGSFYKDFEDVILKLKDSIVLTTQETLFDKILSVVENKNLSKSLSEQGFLVIEKEKGVVNRILKEVGIEES